MLRLALEGEPEAEIDPARARSPGATGYTVDTLHELRLELGRETTLVICCSAPTSTRSSAPGTGPDEVKRLAKIAVFKRPGFSQENRQAQTPLVDMQPMAVAGSEIRARVARGEPIDGLVPAAVANYIAEHGLITPH